MKNVISNIKLYLDKIKSLDGEDIESKATIATKGISSEISNKITTKVASFTEKEMEKIIESIKKNKTSLLFLNSCSNIFINVPIIFLSVVLIFLNAKFYIS